LLSKANVSLPSLPSGAISSLLDAQVKTGGGDTKPGVAPASFVPSIDQRASSGDLAAS